jgi:hypothetical protein
MKVSFHPIKKVSIRELANLMPTIEMGYPHENTNDFYPRKITWKDFPVREAGAWSNFP